MIARAATLALTLTAAAAPAGAEPYRLRADALASAQAPGALVALTSDATLADDVRAEAVLWFVSRDDDATADVLVAVIEGDADVRGVTGTGRLGRFVAAVGALRPVHVDGAAARVRLPARLQLEAFAGIPVEPGGSRGWDWVVGGRGARLLGDWSSVGVGFLERRDHGALVARELGADGSGELGPIDLGARAALDLIHGGLADAQASASTTRGALRVEAYAGQRSAQRLLPATSLFTVLGDVPSRRGGATTRWRAAPRLDLRATAGVRAIGGDVFEELAVRADLRLDDRGRGGLGVALHRDGAPDGGWTGARGTARVPVTAAITVAAELELVRPDGADASTGELWPWALAAATWTRGPWDAAVAVEASASARERGRLDVLARLGRRWDLP